MNSLTINNPRTPEELQEAIRINSLRMAQAQEKYNKTIGELNRFEVSFMKGEAFIKSYLLPIVVGLAVLGAIGLNIFLSSAH